MRFKLAMVGLVITIVTSMECAQAEAAQPVLSGVVSTTVTKTVPADGGSSGGCHTKSYDYSFFNWKRFAEWHVINRCKSVKLYMKTRHVSHKMWPDVFCSTIALWSSYLGILTGPLCVHVFSKDADTTRHKLRYMFTHPRVCVAEATWTDTYPWGRTDVHPCKYHK